MAESYVTKFTKYVAEQRDNLEGKLISKGLIPSANASLGSLVADLDNLQESFKTLKYERDENFPDFDDMFDKDPLRAINGGQYKACIYMLLPLVNNELVCNILDPKPSDTASTATKYYGEKVVISDGTEYENVTTTLTHAMGDSGIYTDSDGFKFGLIKIYSSRVLKQSNGYFCPYAREIIDDYWSVYYPYTNMGKPTGLDSFELKYWRFVCSNTTLADTSGWQLPYKSGLANESYLILDSVEHLRIDGLFKFTTFANLLGWAKLNVLDLRGTMLNTDTETSLSLTFGSAGQTHGYGPALLDYVKTPYSNVPLTVTIYEDVKNLNITDNVAKCIINTGSGSYGRTGQMILEKIHLGNGLQYSLTQGLNYAWFTNLKHVTCSVNTFGKNESAITVDFGYAPKLTKQSILNMFNNFADRTDKTANILKLAKYSEQYLTDEEKAILTNKNWTLTFV